MKLFRGADVVARHVCIVGGGVRRVGSGSEEKQQPSPRRRDELALSPTPHSLHPTPNKPTAQARTLDRWFVSR